MSRKIRLTGINFGPDVTEMEIYHTSTASLNLITESVTQDLFDPYLDLTVEDEYTTLIIRCSEGECLGRTGSVDISYDRNVRYFTVTSDNGGAGGTVEITTPVADGPTSGSLSQTVDFRTFPTFVIEATANYGATFDGWYDELTAGTLVSIDNPLTIEQTTFTGSDDFYAYFS